MTLGRRDNWEQYFAPCKATRSSKPESVAKEVEKKQKERAEQAHFYPVSSTVVSVAILDTDGNEVFSATSGFDGVKGKVAYDTMLTLGCILNGTEDHIFNDMDDVGCCLFGLKIRDRLRIMALDAINYARTHGHDLNSLFPGLWTHKPFTPAIWCDPYEMIIPSERRNDIPYDGLCDFLGIELTQGTSVDADAKLQAQLALNLTLAANLTYTGSDAVNTVDV